MEWANISLYNNGYIMLFTIYIYRKNCATRLHCSGLLFVYIYGLVLLRVVRVWHNNNVKYYIIYLYVHTNCVCEFDKNAIILLQVSFFFLPRCLVETKTFDFPTDKSDGKVILEFRDRII